MRNSFVIGASVIALGTAFGTASAEPGPIGARHFTLGPSLGNFSSIPVSRQMLSRCGPSHSSATG